MLKTIFGRFSSLSLLSIRIGLSWIFIAHGGQKLFGLWGGPGLQGFAGMLESMGMKPGLLWALISSGSEFFGGLMVLLGFYARWGALFIIGVMAVAVATVHAPNGFFLSNKGYEYNVALIAMSLCILFGGPGKFSIRED